MRTRAWFAAVATVFIVIPARAQEAVRAVPAVRTLDVSGGFAAAAGGVFNLGDVTRRLFSLDKDADGRLSRAEFPERMQGAAERADSDRDGVVTREEVERFVRVAASARPNVRSSPKKTATMADIVNDLRLPQPKHALAMELAKNYTNGVRNVNNSREVNLADLNYRMSQILDDDEYENFVAAANRLKSGGRVFLQRTVIVK